MDSFKGCLTSNEAGQAAMEGIQKDFPNIEVACIPVSDGGDGMLDVLVQATGGRSITLNVHDPLMRPCTARYGISPDGHTAFIEMAMASGLSLVPTAQRNPMLTSTYGTGEFVLDALKRGCRNFIIGLGGSATNDAGLGMLQALGYRFLNQTKETLGARFSLRHSAGDRKRHCLTARSRSCRRHGGRHDGFAERHDGTWCKGSA